VKRSRRESLRRSAEQELAKLKRKHAEVFADADFLSKVIDSSCWTPVDYDACIGTMYYNGGVYPHDAICRSGTTPQGWQAPARS